ELSPELHREAFPELEVLEGGEIQPLERRPGNLGRRPAQQAEATVDWNATWHRSRIRSGRAEYARLCECSRVPEEARLPVRVGVHASFEVLARDYDVVASRAVAGVGRTAKGDGLSALQHGTPAHSPASQQSVRHPARARHVGLALTEGKLVT